MTLEKKSYEDEYVVQNELSRRISYSVVCRRRGKTSYTYIYNNTKPLPGGVAVVATAANAIPPTTGE